jgi:hypothetical protein
LTSATTATKLAFDVEFYKGTTLVFSYDFTNSVLTNYLLEDGSSGESVQVTFASQKITINYAPVSKAEWG